MFDKLKGLVESLVRRAEPFDPQVLNDEIARATEWTPAVQGGTNIGTHRLKQLTSSRVAFKATLAARLVGGIFFVVGLLPMLLGVGSLVGGDDFFIDSQGNSVPGLPLLLFGIAFTLFGWWLLKKMGAPRQFDRRCGCYWKGSKDPDAVPRREDLDDYTDLGTVHALQIIKERCSTDSGYYYSYELNLVCKDASRVNVVDHDKLRVLRTDALQLAEFLGGIPLWDATLPASELAAAHPPAEPQWPGPPPAS
jgi:hypothetical protein